MRAACGRYGIQMSSENKAWVAFQGIQRQQPVRIDLKDRVAAADDDISGMNPKDWIFFGGGGGRGPKKVTPMIGFLIFYGK